MGYSRVVSHRSETLYGKYYDLIAELPPRKTTTFHFRTTKEFKRVRFRIYNWIKVNHYEDAYRIEVGEDKLSLLITNQAKEETPISPDEIHRYLASLPTEGLFEATLAFIEAFSLLPQTILETLSYQPSNRVDRSDRSDRSESDRNESNQVDQPSKPSNNNPDDWF